MCILYRASENTIANGAVFGRVLAHNNAALKSLRLRGTISASCAAALPLLADTSFRWTGNCMVGFEAEFLLNGLTKNTSLTHLDLSGTSLMRGGRWEDMHENGGERGGNELLSSAFNVNMILEFTRFHIVTQTTIFMSAMPKRKPFLLRTLLW